jgi:hypothetical protein
MRRARASARTHTRTGIVHCVLASRITPISNVRLPVVMQRDARPAVRVILRRALH